MKNLIIILLALGIASCGTTKDTNNSTSTCNPAIQEADLDASRIDSTNSFFKFSLIEHADKELKLIVNYSGGCENHEFFLVKKSEQKSEDYHSFWIAHNSNGDSCREWVTDTICFNLDPIKMNKGDKFWVDGYYGEFVVD